MKQLNSQDALTNRKNTSKVSLKNSRVLLKRNPTTKNLYVVKKKLKNNLNMTSSNLSNQSVLKLKVKKALTKKEKAAMPRVVAAIKNPVKKAVATQAPKTVIKIQMKIKASKAVIKMKTLAKKCHKMLKEKVKAETLLKAMPN